MAYADTSAFDDDQTASVDNISSSSTPAEDIEPTGVSSSTNQISINNSVTNNMISNSTITEVIPTNSTGMDIPIILPNATESWQFDTRVNGSRFIGDIYIEETNSSLILDDDGYVSNNGNSTNDITNLSVTAW